MWVSIWLEYAATWTFLDRGWQNIALTKECLILCSPRSINMPLLRSEDTLKAARHAKLPI